MRRSIQRLVGSSARGGAAPLARRTTSQASSLIYSSLPILSGSSTTKRLQPHLRPNETQTREYTAEPAAAAVQLGKQTRRWAPIEEILRAITVGRMLDYKTSPEQIFEVSENDKVIKAIDVMLEKDIGSVLVRGTGTERKVGMVTKEDCMQKMVLKGRLARQTDVKDIMKVQFPCVTRETTLAQCIGMMAVRTGPIRYLPVVTNLGELDGDPKVMGMISEREIMTWFVRAFLDAEDTDVINGHAPITDVCSQEHGYENGAFVQESDTVYDALKILAENKATGAIVNQGPEAVGLFTGTDYLRGIIQPGLRSKDRKVGDVMTKKMVIAPPHFSVLDCLNVMLQNNVHHLPVGEYIPCNEPDASEGCVAFDTESRGSLALLTASDIIAFVGNQAHFVRSTEHETKNQ